jgi:hypothetical protein
MRLIALQSHEPRANDMIAQPEAVIPTKRRK